MGAVPRTRANMQLLEERRPASHAPAIQPRDGTHGANFRSEFRSEFRLRVVAPAVEVTPVSSCAELAEFIDFPWDIYAGHPNWTPSPPAELQRALASRNPGWGPAQRALLLARRGREVVGRIAALADDNGRRHHDERAGAFGCFECRDDRAAAAALFAAAESWLADQGHSFVRGPFGASQLQQPGLLVAGHQFPGSAGTPYQPQYYQRLIEGCGFERDHDELSFAIGKSSRPSRRIALLAERLQRRGAYRIRRADTRRLGDELRLAARLCARADDGASPSSAINASAGMRAAQHDEAFDELTASLQRCVERDLFKFFLCGEEPVGVCLVLPDNAPLLRRLGRSRGLPRALRRVWHRRAAHGLRSLLIGFQPAHAQAGLPALAALHFHRLLRHSPRYEQLVIGGVPGDDRQTIEFLAEIGARQQTRTRLYRKPL